MPSRDRSNVLHPLCVVFAFVPSSKLRRLLSLRKFRAFRGSLQELLSFRATLLGFQLSWNRGFAAPVTVAPSKSRHPAVLFGDCWSEVLTLGGSRGHCSSAAALDIHEAQGTKNDPRAPVLSEHILRRNDGSLHFTWCWEEARDSSRSSMV